MTEGDAPPDGAALMRGYLEHSPFALHLGLELREIEDGRAVLALPYQDPLATIGDVVHGGAITSLIDTAATAAAWAGAELSDSPGGATVGLSVSFLRAARGGELTAEARVTRRGGRLCFCHVDVTGGDGEVVAQALVTYRLR